METNPRFEEDCRIGQQVRFLSYIDSDNHEAFRLLDRIVSFSEYSYSLRNDNGRLNEFGGQEQTLIYSSRSRSRGFSRKTLRIDNSAVTQARRVTTIIMVTGSCQWKLQTRSKIK